MYPHGIIKETREKEEMRGVEHLRDFARWRILSGLNL
jgi:hypothetical protein